ncbi:hypothetical protein N7462_009715 [Penicillium macrosclerotiorum]|uniref:uncharacterized protein n=1 Tax=Penicillium macrosclerotiorum TaxID=303699 RepID=UPI0025497486|nr:uncharacterized protein N7462_009715 [Penicillium macrosclerotiorum]KAJ5668645.1 hypothetical protein N7462_009715 [Penicillium macrosclerotiorum]
MASSESSTSSLPNRDQPRHIEQKSKFQLDTLLSHLLAAKRSLSSINHVWRANEIVTSARAALEESVVVSSRTGFLRRGLNNQLQLLYNVRSEVEDISHRGREDFANALKNLDAADIRLRSTLDLLRNTVVHASFRAKDEGAKSLHDFVDERGVEELHVSMKSSIDRTNTARAALDSSNREFDHELSSIRQALKHYRTATKMATSRPSASSSSSSTSEPVVITLSTMPGMIHALEENAQEMAGLLESLVRHFDLCVTAVKHTEGGGAAARSITGDISTEVQASGDAMPKIGEEIHANLNAPLDPMTDSEYEEMVNVIIKDAPEADEVVIEIQDRIADMETVFEQVITQRNALLAISNETLKVHNHLTTLASNRLPNYILQAHEFTSVWNGENDQFNNGLAELADLNALYDGFLNAYDSLILEVARRGHLRQRMEKVLRDTQHKLTQLYEEDVAARAAFRVEQGDFLPSDIWPGIANAPMQVRFLRTAGGQLDGNHVEEGDPQPRTDSGAPVGITDDSVEGEVIPDLPKDVVEKAYARMKARSREFV